MPDPDTERGTIPETGRKSKPAERLVAAGWEVIDDLPLARAFAGATTAAVAERAGVTTGSFFHHFANSAAFADALALSFLDDDPPMPEPLPDLVAALDEVALGEILRGAMVSTWRETVDDAAVAAEFRHEMALWTRHRDELADPVDGHRTVGDILRQRYNARQEAPAEVWTALLDLVGRSVTEPFTTQRLATAISALFQGLVVRHAVDPDAVDDELFGELVAMLVLSLSRVHGAGGPVASLVRPHHDQQRSPQARSGERRRRETRRRILDAVPGMFSAGWESVAASDVAERAGVSVQTISNQFQSVRSLAAATFAEHLPSFRDAASATRPDTGPPTSAVESLRNVLESLAVAAAADGHVARALLSERVLAELVRGDHVTPTDIRNEVPIAPIVSAAVAAVVPDTVDVGDITTNLIDFVLVHAVPRQGRAAETAELALRLVPGLAPGVDPSLAADTTDRGSHGAESTTRG